jgi:hypothetical protein
MIPMAFERATAEVGLPDDQLVAGSFRDCGEIGQGVVGKAVANGQDADGFGFQMCSEGEERGEAQQEPQAEQEALCVVVWAVVHWLGILCSGMLGVGGFPIGL